MALSKFRALRREFYFAEIGHGKIMAENEFVGL